MSGYRQTLARTSLVIGALGAAPWVGAQSVAIGGTSLQLGAPRAATLAKAKTYFRVLPAGGDQYTLYPNGLPSANANIYPPAIGALNFANGRLARVTRYLGSFRCDAGKIAIDNLISAFAQAPKTHHLPQVHTERGQSGNASIRQVYFSYQDRAIQIVVYQPAERSQQATVSITEQYTLPQKTKPVKPK
jgi:hypothetical protein